MTDITDIGGIVTSLKGAIELARVIRDTGTSLEEADRNLKFADLITALADARMEMAAVQETLLRRDADIRQLKDQLEVRGRMRYQAPYYWLETESGEDGPYCQKCYDADAKPIRLQKSDPGLWRCMVCAKLFTDSSYVEPSYEGGSGVDY